MSIETYMNLCLGHPEYGYYMTRDPLGKEGDFTTAPEISQLFGEMIGLCLADYYLNNYRGYKFALVELGPGRGTLMDDILRVTKDLSEFQDNLSIDLVETSPVLREIQKKKLGDRDLQWHNGIDTLPDDVPLLIVANEFFDALPIRQAIYFKKQWHEKVLVLEGEDLCFGIGQNLPGNYPRYPNETNIYEISKARHNIALSVSQRIEKQGGIAVIIDYGHVKSSFGDTLQAVKKHEYADILFDCGEADLTSHVDFQALLEGINSRVCGPVEQGDFLKKLGIEIRAKALSNADTNSQLQRLISSKQMGKLFKVVAIHPHGNIKPPEGF